MLFRVKRCSCSRVPRSPPNTTSNLTPTRACSKKMVHASQMAGSPQDQESPQPSEIRPLVSTSSASVMDVLHCQILYRFKWDIICESIVGTPKSMVKTGPIPAHHCHHQDRAKHTEISLMFSERRKEAISMILFSASQKLIEAQERRLISFSPTCLIYQRQPLTLNCVAYKKIRAGQISPPFTGSPSFYETPSLRLSRQTIGFAASYFFLYHPF